MPRAKEQISASEVFAALGKSAREQARKPNIHGYVPHAKQKELHEKFKRFTLYIGGNRAGKTTGGTAEVVWYITGTHPYKQTKRPPVAARVIGPDFIHSIATILLPKMMQLLPKSELKGGSWETAYNKELRILTLENGSTVQWMSYEQKVDQFAGTSIDIIHFDEEPPRAIFIENLFRLMDVKGHWIMTLTPVIGMEWMYDEIYLPGRNGVNPNISVIEVATRDNTYLDPEEIDLIAAQVKDEDDRETRLQGRFIKRGGSVFKHFDRHVHIVEPYLPPVEYQWYASMDHGYANPTAWLWHAVSPDGQIVTFDEHYARELTVGQHAGIVHERNRAHGKVPNGYIGDPAIKQRNGINGNSIQVEYSLLKIPIALGNNDVLTGVNRINSYLRPNPNFGDKPSWHITENCVHLIDEIEKLRWRTWASKEMERQNNPHEEIHKLNDHAPDAARYFFSMMPDLTYTLPVETFDHESIGQLLGATTSIKPNDRIDTNLLKQRNTTEWDISHSEAVGLF